MIGAVRVCYSAGFVLAVTLLAVLGFECTNCSGTSFDVDSAAFLFVNASTVWGTIVLGDWGIVAAAAASVTIVAFVTADAHAGARNLIMWLLLPLVFAVSAAVGYFAEPQACSPI